MNTSPSTPFRVAIEHGGLRNVGDIAMLWNTIRRIRRAVPGVRILVRGETDDPPVGFLESEQRYPSLLPVFRKLHQRACTSWRRRLPSAVRVRLAQVEAATMYRTITRKRSRAATHRGNLHRNGYMPFLRSLSECDAFFVAGHGGVTEHWLYGTVYTIHTEAVAAKRNGKTVLLSGQGLGPLASRFGRAFVRRAFAQCDAATVRDLDSQRFLERLGCTRHIRLGGDDAGDLPFSEESIRARREELLASLPDGIQRIVALSIRPKASARRHPFDVQQPRDLIQPLANGRTAVVDRKSVV